ncbi:phosphoribosylglycinamide formyltransferase [Chloracidobacterium aggregatum]|uniref:Phosphoribosylglycinamide formyltransferase n=1 Tax=Chloracidobacterium sp. N TaxID=2821540 RepID=A0ABX8AZR9_9BACT|nr:phosphoribosylglycinamide formyltransferase [Chloracidobacterium aggregatum]QUV85502.1 phosphoribosylglycinamide formyltransferase [Chloracidobacterium sp. 2]QUV88094.1 phosphoribosylglycinamide formyltransferase [Chloracidobacterium sp. S]QUV91017.1 phosphoribosylglycinamide formyltransferase [Chloracidobacterium sp. A]QUV94204.1 phosphoribosylglycinamide formyltransferase [Chloracidobacterium sp. N]QUV97403.1 phosphoribosylglycinamide formyltransferase [Chloracidobacterium sp. E]
MSERPGLVVLISGRGSNLRALAEAIRQGRLRASLAAVISNRADAPGLNFATEQGIPTHVVSHVGLSRAEHSAALLEVIRPYNPRFICLAGFMRLLAPSFIQAFLHRVVNIHPSLLPAFPGLDAQRQALDYGVKVSGCTVHLVDEELDHGPIVMQSAVPVLDDDTPETLATRILAAEHKTYPAAIERLLYEPWTLEGRRVVFQSAQGQSSQGI